MASSARRRGLFIALATCVLAALAPATTAQAVPDPVGQRELTLYFVDSEHPFASPCPVGLTLSSHVTPGLTPHESGFVNIVPEGRCATTTWSARVTIIDTAPGHATRAVSKEGGPASPLLVRAWQDIPYGVGVREAGVVTIQLEIWSRLGSLCVIDFWRTDAVTALASPITFTDCTS